MIQVWGVGGAIKLVVLIAVAVALPLSGAGADAAFDWGLIFIALVFVIIPVLCLVHLVLTPFAAVHFDGRRRLAEAASMVVPLSYLVVGCYALGIPWTAARDAIRVEGPTTEEDCAASEGIWDAHGRTCVDDRRQPRALNYP